MPEPRDVLSLRLKRQAAGCAELGSPFYASLLEKSAADLEGEGVVRQVLRGFEHESAWAALALRMMGAVHRLVLLHELPELAPHYPSTGGDGDPDAAWPIFKEALVDRRDEIRKLMARGCQTNEVGRSAALIGGFLAVAHRTKLPLRLLEVGASAGLNLRWDKYRYESTAGAWGEESSPVRFDHAFDVPPPLNRSADVLERKGCDLEPIDSASEEGALTLRSFVWADQLSRLALLDGAISIAREMPLEIEQLDAATFLERELASPVPGVATLVFHSVFMQYVSAEGRKRILGAIENAEDKATPVAPVDYLRMEPNNGTFEVRLGRELVATSRAHGTGVRWLVS